MARTRRSEEEKLEDQFFDLDLKGQERVLEMLQRLHRLKRRQQPDSKALEPDKPADEPQAKLAMEG